MRLLRPTDRHGRSRALDARTAERHACQACCPAQPVKNPISAAQLLLKESALTRRRPSPGAMSENSTKNTNRAAIGKTRLTKAAVEKPDTLVFLPDGRQITLCVAGTHHHRRRAGPASQQQRLSRTVAL